MYCTLSIAMRDRKTAKNFALSGILMRSLFSGVGIWASYKSIIFLGSGIVITTYFLLSWSLTFFKGLRLRDEIPHCLKIIFNYQKITFFGVIISSCLRRVQLLTLYSIKGKFQKIFN